MTERSIGFTDWMVDAILDGRKTVTRRLIKEQPDTTEQRLRELGAWVEGLTLSQHVNNAWRAGFIPVDCPYGEPGDLLLIKETGDRRVLLEITDVRVERLQDGDGETAFESRYLAEGINRIHHGDGEYYFHASQSEPGPGNWVDPFDAWRELWTGINGVESWAANPWVWVVEFRRVMQ